MRASCHILEIERGRYTVPKTQYQILCNVCHEAYYEIPDNMDNGVRGTLHY